MRRILGQKTAVTRNIDERIGARLRRLYGDEVGARTTDRLLRRLDRWGTRGEPAGDPRCRRLPFDQRDVVLITFGDSLRGDAEPPLAVLRRMLELLRQTHERGGSLSRGHGAAREQVSK